MLKDRLKEIIAIVEASGVDEVEISTWWGRKIKVRKSAAAEGNPASLSPQPGVSRPPAVDDHQAGAAAGEPETVGDASRRKQIQAPIVGTFYRAASQDAKPYIESGDRISVGQVICIIEAMKIMNEIESDVGGTVIDILVANGTPVEFNQPLVVVDPS
ncbi:MAG: acetyl-CoA carboxylase biotin carboxyl carrier protein [Candidatus Neomarinimicrobiota bacterium]